MLPNPDRQNTPPAPQASQEASSSLSPLLEVPDHSPSPSPSPSPTGLRRTSATTPASKGQRSSLGIASGRPLVHPMTSTMTSASGAGATAAADALATPVHHSRRVSSVRPSFSTFRGDSHRRSRAPSRVSSHHHAFEDDDIKLPSLVPGIRPAYSTPLPVLPMVVLCIVSWRPNVVGTAPT